MVIPIQTELPQLLHTSAANSTWVITITLLAAAISMPVAGRLADLFGKQRVLVGSATILLASSVICALSSSLAPMLVGRALQGLALGFIPVGISLIREITPPQMASTAIASMSATLGVGGAIGLPLAAWIVQAGSWHTLFWVGLRDGGGRAGPGVGRRPARARRSAGTPRPRRDPRSRGRARLVPGRHLEGHHVGVG